MTPEAVDHAAKAVLTQLSNRRKSNVESLKNGIKTSKLINPFYLNG